MYKMLSLDAIRNNLYMDIVGEKDDWMKHYNFDDNSELVIVNGYPEDCPHYIVNSDIDDHFTISYYYDGCSEYSAELWDDENGSERILTRQEVVDFFNKKDIEKITN